MCPWRIVAISTVLVVVAQSSSADFSLCGLPVTQDITNTTGVPKSGFQFGVSGTGGTVRDAEIIGSPGGCAVLKQEGVAVGTASMVDVRYPSKCIRPGDRVRVRFHSDQRPAPLVGGSVVWFEHFTYPMPLHDPSFEEVVVDVGEGNAGNPVRWAVTEPAGHWRPTVAATGTPNFFEEIHGDQLGFVMVSATPATGVLEQTSQRRVQNATEYTLLVDVANKNGNPADPEFRIEAWAWDPDAIPNPVLKATVTEAETLKVCNGEKTTALLRWSTIDPDNDVDKRWLIRLKNDRAAQTTTIDLGFDNVRLFRTVPIEDEIQRWKNLHKLLMQISKTSAAVKKKINPIGLRVEHVLWKLDHNRQLDAAEKEVSEIKDALKGLVGDVAFLKMPDGAIKTVSKPLFNEFGKRAQKGNSPVFDMIVHGKISFDGMDRTSDVIDYADSLASGPEPLSALGDTLTYQLVEQEAFQPVVTDSGGSSVSSVLSTWVVILNDEDRRILGVVVASDPASSGTRPVSETDLIELDWSGFSDYVVDNSLGYAIGPGSVLSQESALLISSSAIAAIDIELDVEPVAGPVVSLAVGPTFGRVNDAAGGTQLTLLELGGDLGRTINATVPTSVSATLGVGTFNGTAGALGGSLRLPGFLRLCFFLGNCGDPGAMTTSVPLTLNQTVGLGAGGLLTVGSGTMRISLIGAPWTIGTQTVTTTINGAPGATLARSGSPASNTSGILQVISPFRVVTSSGGTTRTQGGFAELEVRFAPEPRTLLLFGSGALLVALLGRTRTRR